MQNLGIVLQPRGKGIGLALLSAVFWGVTGVVVQYLFEHEQFSSERFVVVRLLVSGVILLWFAAKIEKRDIWAIWRSADKIRLFLFGIFGVLSMQYTYFLSIEFGNAAAATVLQYLAPVIVTAYGMFLTRKLPAWKEICAVVFAVVGMFLVVTRGDLHSLAVSEAAFFWGIVSAFMLAFYTVQPRQLLISWGAALAIGWAMIIGGVLFSLFCPPWPLPDEISLAGFLGASYVILFGTVLAFAFFLESIRYIRPSEASIVATLEPFVAVVLSVLWLDVPFDLMQWIGAFGIVGAVALLAYGRKS